MLLVRLKRRGFSGRPNATNHHWVMEDILPQPASRKGHSAPNPWVLPRVEPTTLILAWPHREPPPLTSVTAALSSSAYSEVLDESTHESPLVEWSLQCRVPPHPTPVSVNETVNRIEMGLEGLIGHYDTGRPKRRRGDTWAG